MDAESQPVKMLEARKETENTRLKLFQEFKAKFDGITKTLGDLGDFKSFRELKYDLGDGANIAAVTIDKDKAQPGRYTIQVDELAARTSVISNGFEDPDEKILGVGFISMNPVNGESRDIYVDDEHSSLHGVANLINGDPTSPVQAAVIKDSTDEDSPWKLIMTAKKDGKVNEIEFPDLYFLDGDKDIYIDANREAKNASVTVDGFPVQLESNDMNDFLPGVNMHLKQARPDQPFTLSITEDHQKIGGKVKGLVDAMNNVFDFIYKQNAVDEHSDTKNSFAGDTSLQTIEYRLRNLMHEGFPAGEPGTDSFHVVHLNEIGVEFGKDGKLAFKEDKFTKSLEKDFAGISEAVTGPSGLAAQLKVTLAGYTTPGTGLLAQRESSMRSRIRDIDNQIDNKQRMLDRRQQALVDQFSRLESSLSNMQRQQAALSAALPAGGGGGNLVQQLLGG